MQNIIAQINKIGLNIHSQIQPLIQNIKPLTLDKYIENSTIKSKSKKYYTNLFRRYINYCNEKLIINKEIINPNCPLDVEFNAYDPSNVLDFIHNKCHFKRTSIQKILKVFLRALRKCTRNPSLEYPSSIGNPQKPYLKHYINNVELNNFMNYLKMKEDFQTFVIFEILYKFGVRVGAISKAKIKDISEEGIITFYEKNEKIAKRKLGKKLIQKLNFLISINHLKNDDYLFYNNYKGKTEEDRSNFFSLKLNRIIKSSKCFSEKRGEILCAHMFRATHAIDTFQSYGLMKAAEELGHSQVSTTKYNYLKPDENNLYLNEENIIYKNIDHYNIFNYDIYNKKKFLNKKREGKNSMVSKRSTVNNTKRNKNIMNIASSDSSDEEDNEDDSIYDGIFEYNSVPKLEINNDNKYSNEIFKSEKNFINHKELFLKEDKFEDLENFYLNNKISLAESFVINAKYAQPNEILSFKTTFYKYHGYSLISEMNIPFKEKENINHIKFCNNFKEIKFFDISTLMKMKIYNENKDKIFPNIFDIFCDKNEIKATTKVDIEKNTFLCDCYGYYAYKKSLDKIKESNDVVYTKLLFKCKDINYSRYFYFLKGNHLSNLFLSKGKVKTGNAMLMNYLDLEMNIVVGIFSIKKILAGERVILSNTI